MGSKELDQMHGLNLYDYHARQYESAIGRFTTVDPLAEKYYSISPYVYCGNNPISRIDTNGREWTYVVGANGHTTINVALNFSISGNYTAAQISAYKNAIVTQFHNTISQSSGGTMSGTVTFHEGNANIIQSLSLGQMNDNIGGTTSYFNSSVNLFNSAGELRSLSSVASDATHEVLHTLRLDHPFEVTQTADTKLLRVAPNSFVSTPTTDKNIVNNIMSYPMNNHRRIKK
jgi:RHS repeat-associated protein